MEYLARLEALHPDIIDNFLASGESQAIPIELQQFIMQLQYAIEIKEYESNINRAAKKLRERVWATQKIRLNINTAKARIYNAMVYFDVDDNIPQKVWDRDAANKFESLAKLAIAQDKINEAGRFIDRANELRRRANTADSGSGNNQINFLISTDYKIEDGGFERKNLKQIAAKANKGFYINLINGLPLSQEEKEPLYRDADIEEADFEEINENGE
ncbi:hypothetical protein [Plebeiibacterium sediminum]|uniref:Uncharacterized protein n=1 Tax=Plebeiibacterium sediminum TaxID=2992112 RepID=A0AAE3M0S3_9BACT|nr:hypothetical protein [Plebeiobacterium sediminum]MCW3784924.1 hypothetical protein [Plebeiobacterium sediminum]